MNFVIREPFDKYNCDAIIDVVLNYQIDQSQTIIILNFPNDPKIKVTIGTALTVSEIEHLSKRIVSDWLYVKHGYFSKPILSEV